MRAFGIATREVLRHTTCMLRATQITAFTTFNLLMLIESHMNLTA